MQKAKTPKTKIYKYGEHKYKMLPASLDLLNKAVPVLIRYKKLEFQHVSDLDMTAVIKVQERLEELEYAIKDLEESKSDNARLIELKGKLAAEQAEFLNDSGLQSGIALYNELRGMAMFELVTDIKIMKPFLFGILEGDVEKLNFEDTKIIAFIQEVVSDFFLIMKESKKK